MWGEVLTRLFELSAWLENQKSGNQVKNAGACGKAKSPCPFAGYPTKEQGET
jgi:hypothetical protein